LGQGVHNKKWSLNTIIMELMFPFLLLFRKSLRGLLRDCFLGVSKNS